MATVIESTFALRSVAFSHEGHIPPKYTCEGENVNPPLEIGGVPEDTKTLALIMEDPDATSGRFVHWLLWNIYPNEAIPEKVYPGVAGRNSFGKAGYGGPCPPSGQHRYYFKVYALDTILDLPPGSDKNALHKAMEGHVLGTSELMAYYKKHQSK